MKDLKKTVLITGASGGIGYELAKLFAEGSYNLVLVARSEDRLNEVAAELQSAFDIDVTVIAKDLFEKESPFEIYDEVNAKGIQVSILVNDAAQGEYGEFSETDIYRELDIIQLNVGSVITLTKLFLRDMIERNEGKILNVGSIAGEAPGPWQAVYHGTKAFIHSWSAAIRNELKDTQVQVTVLVPGATDTDFFHKANMEDSKILETKLSDPAEVARDGYNALLAGEDKRVSGMKNKVQVTMGQVMSDSMSAENMKKQQEPKDEAK